MDVTAREDITSAMLCGMAEDEARELLARAQQEPDGPEWLDADEACAWLRVDKAVLYRAAQIRQIPAVKIGREWRVHRPTLVAQARGEWPSAEPETD